MDAPENPWAERFTALLDPMEIVRRAQVMVDPLTDLDLLPAETAAKTLESSLRRAFYPTQQCVAILKDWVGMAYSHCLASYPSRKAFLRAIYDDAPLLPDEVQPICLTGLAGLGKTEVLRAFERIQEPPAPVAIDANHDAFPVEAHWLTRVQNRNSPQQLLTDLAGVAGKRKDLVAMARARAFRRGVAFVGVDEFQFVSQSTTANTLLTQILLSTGFLGLPVVYVANYSMVHKLMRRPQEDRQRLLSRPCVLQADRPESEDWIRVLQTLKDAAPGILNFDPVEDARTIFLFSAGIKRLVVRLICLAYKSSRRSNGIHAAVSVAEIEDAYRSTAFTSDRRDVEIIARQEIEYRGIREDLWCPFELPKVPKPATACGAGDDNPFARAREEKVAEEALKSSLTKAEWEACSKPTRQAKKAADNVVKMPKKLSLSADDLRRNADKLRGRFT